MGRSRAISLHQHRLTSRYLRDVDKTPQNAKTQPMFKRDVSVIKFLLILCCYWLLNQLFLPSSKQALRRIQLLPRTPITIMEIAFSVSDYRSLIVLTLKRFWCRWHESNAIAVSSPSSPSRTHLRQTPFQLLIAVNCGNCSKQVRVDVPDALHTRDDSGSLKASLRSESILPAGLLVFSWMGQSWTFLKHVINSAKQFWSHFRWGPVWVQIRPSNRLWSPFIRVCAICLSWLTSESISVLVKA